MKMLTLCIFCQSGRSFHLCGAFSSTTVLRLVQASAKYSNSTFKIHKQIYACVHLYCVNILKCVHRPKSSRYCEKPLLNNLVVFIVFSFIATGSYQFYFITGSFWIFFSFLTLSTLSLNWRFGRSAHAHRSGSQDYQGGVSLIRFVLVYLRALYGHSHPDCTSMCKCA